MFGLRQVVESLSASPGADNDQPRGSRPSTPLGHSSVRKSLAQSQRGRSASPAPRISSTGKKLSLEDRLKASLANGDASTSKQETQSTSDSQKAISASSNPPDIPPNSSNVPPPVSPRLVPLPDSPSLSPVLEKLPEDTLDDVTQKHTQEPSDITKTSGSQSNLNDAHGSTNQDSLKSLQERLKQVEQRFLDVSESFKTLQANKVAVDDIFHELTPLHTTDDTVALSDYLKSIISKPSSYQNDIKEFEAKVREQKRRIQELSEKHSSELRSQSELIERLRSQANEAEALFKVSQQTSSEAQGSVQKQKDEAQKLQAELEQAKNVAKEEEEKRVKAISLLKTVRQKLVKTEKERDEALKEVTLLKQREQGDKEKDQFDKVRFQEEINAAKAEKEKSNAKIRAQFENELVTVQERYEKELSVLKGQFELESVTLKASHTKELSLKASQVTTLETSLNNITRDKNQMFDQLQLRQAEVESVQSHLESLQNQNMEVQYQLREAQDRIALLTYDLQETQREQESHSHQVTTSPEEVARLLSSTELKYETKLIEMRTRLQQVEIERNDIESEWSRKVRDKVKEVDDLKSLLETSSRSQDEHEKLVDSLRTEKAQLEDEIRLSQQKSTELLSAKELVEDIEKSAKEQEKELTNTIQNLERQIGEANIRETQLRLSNKTLREELRKVQSSITLLERQRSPGIGYWSPRPDESAPAEPRTSIQSDSTSRAGSPAPAQSDMSAKKEEEINVEYLRNVILQFLEHKEMRPNLVRVMSILLRFTPQETRRLMAKV